MRERKPGMKRRATGAGTAGPGLATLLCCLAAGAVGSVEEAAIETAAPPATLDPVLAATEEALALLNRYKLPIDKSDGMCRVVESVLQMADPGARVLGPEEIRHREALGEGFRYAVGLSIQRSNGMVRVTAVTPGSPAAEAGIEAGDELVSVGGDAVKGLNVSRLAARLRGNQPRTVEVSVTRPDESPLRVALEQRPLRVEAVGEVRGLPVGLRYVRLNDLTEEAAAEVAQHISHRTGEEGPVGIILDLRGAGGATPEAAVRVASLLAEPKGPLFSFRDGTDQDLEVHHAAATDRLQAPLMILIDERTHGAAELLAATLAGIGRGAMLIGQHTAGDPLIREQVEMPNGTHLLLATRRLVIVNGDVYTGREVVQPDIFVRDDAPHREYEPEPPILTDHRSVSVGELEVKALRKTVKGDVTLVRAVDVLLGLRALNIQGFDYGGPKAR